MVYLTFDSNIWIYLLDKSWTESNPLDYLEHWLSEKQIKILVPEIIIKEWDRNKEEQKVVRLTRLREFFSMAREIIPSGFIQQFNTPENLNRILDEQFQRIENIITVLGELLPISQEVKFQSVQRGLDRKAPMHKKSSMADTLIVLSMIEFATDRPGDEFYFISNNVEDFFERLNGRHEIHSDLKAYFDQLNIKALRYLDQLLHELKNKLPVLIDIESLKKDRIKAKLEQQIYNPVVSEAISGAKASYLTNIDFLDLVIVNETPTKEQILFTLNLIESEDSYSYYFFKHCKKLVWFQIFIERGTFKPSNNPYPIKTEKGYTILGWWPMLYLLTISGDSTFQENEDSCKTLINILEEISKFPRDNNRTWYFLILILEKLPNKFISEHLLNYIPVWLTDKLDNSMVSSNLCEKLLRKFCLDQPTAEDRRKCSLITKLLFSVQKGDLLTRNDSQKGFYYSPVYAYYLAGIPLDEQIVREVVTADGELIIYHLCKNLKLLLHDYPQGITTTVKYGTRQYTITAMIENDDVIISSREKATDTAGQISKVRNFLNLPALAFNETLTGILLEHGIIYNKAENDVYALDIIRIGLYHGKSYQLNETSINDLESNNEHEEDIFPLFTLMLTKLLVEYCKQFPTNTSALLHNIWKEYPLPVFRRVILYIISKNWSLTRDLFTKLVGDKTLLFSDYEYEKEIYFLLKNNTGLYTDLEVRLLKEIIEAGPSDISNDIDSVYAENWKLRWYAALRDHAEFENEYISLSDKLKKTSEEFEKKQEGIIRSGSVSPFSTEEILKKSNQEIVEFIQHFKPTDRWAEPNTDGLAERLGKAVEKDPERFAIEINLYKDASFIYVYYMLNGFQEAWKNKITFNWEKILHFCNDYITQTKFKTGELRLSSDSWGATDEWVAGSIGRLLSLGMQSDDHAFDVALLPITKEIVTKLAGDLQLPKEVRHEKMDYPTYSLNSTAGKVLRAIFDYSLRRARLQYKIEDTGKWEPDIKRLFEQTLENGIIDGYILQGMYFEQFYFLDKEWLRLQIDKNLQIEEPKWKAFMSGFVFGRALNSQELYTWMLPHYTKAISSQVEFSAINERTMVRHLVSFYFWGYETLDDHKLVYQFLQESPPREIEEFIGFLSRQDQYYRELKPEDKPAFEEKVLAIWRMMAEKHRSAVNEEEKKMISSLASMASFMPKLDSEITELILLSVKNMTEYYHWHGMIQDLLAFSESEQDPDTASNIGKILLASSSLPLHTDYEAERFKALVVYLFTHGQHETAELICDMISRQSHTFLRDTYNQYRNRK